MDIAVMVLLLGAVLQTGLADKPPVFVKYMNNEELLESTEPGKIVYTLSGYDPEGTKVKYGVYGDVFYVHPRSGQVELKRRLDFERNQHFIVTFTISDMVNLVKKTATIYLKDVNDVKPSFLKSTYFREIDETFPVGGIIIKDISIKDEDGVNDLLTVTCDPGTAYVEACETFRVKNTGTKSSQSWQGELVLNKPLNYEKKKNYQVPLVAFDGVNKQTKSVEIRVLDVPDTPPYFVRTLSISINEETPVGTEITKVSAVDGDKFSPRPLKYEIYNDVHKLFAINTDSGAITIAKTLDREGPLLRLGYTDISLKVREVIGKNPLVLGNSSTTTANTTIRVTILDINDNKPKFTSSYVATIPEDIPNNVGIPNLLMTVIDIDSGTNANYIFLMDKYSDTFEIRPNYGEGISTTAIRVKNTSLIDYEKGPRKYEFKVTALESNTTEKYSGTTTVSIFVTDVNDNTPIPASPFYVASVSETARVGTPVTTIQAYDADSGDFGTQGIRYAGLKGMYSNLFILNNRTGQVTVAPCSTPGKYPCLDYDFRHQINLTIEIVDNKDAKSNVQRTLVDLIINVNDANDNKPVFPIANYYGKIAEGSSEPAPEVIVKAEDIDMINGQIRYSLINSEVPGLFQINLNTGKITATRPVKMSDAGLDSYITMEVIASDGMYSATASVRIEVLDRNNNKPIFQQKSYKTCIPENFTGGKFVLSAIATDADKPGTSNSKLSYVIATGAEGQFTIDQSGTIKSSFQARFDYEKKRVYVFKVVARDNGSPQLSESVSVEICITDVNDVAPYFDPFTMQVNVKEDVPVGYSITKLNGVDPDTNSKMEFRFAEPSNAINPNGVPVDKNKFDYTSLFSLDINTGVIRVAKTLDRDRTSLITQTLNVVDVNGLKAQTGTGTIIINIQDVNKIPPVFSPPWTKARPFYNVTLNEEQSVGSFVTILNAIDEDGAIEGYRLNDPDGYFSITNGVVTVKNRIDFEKVERLRFLAYAWDNVQPKMTATATVNVLIKNINDNTPQFQTLYHPIIAENSPVGTNVIEVTATDEDKGDYGVIRYEIGDRNSPFQINPVTGQITVKNSTALDRERVKQIVLQVTAYDSPKDPSVRFNTTVQVYIELRDQNDNPPVFVKKSYYETVVDSIPVGSRIIDISARDADIGLNAIINYEKSSYDSEDLFNVSRNGAISVKRRLVNKIGNHTFQVTAVNGPYKDTAEVTIGVFKGASIPPTWIIPDRDNLIIPVLESQYLGMFVFQVKAQDPDQGPSGLVSYSFLVDQTITQKTNDFMINPVTGVIRAERVFDREEKDLYTLILIARDRSQNPQNIHRRLTIQIRDVNDNKPQFPTLDGKVIKYSFEVPEGSPIGYHIGDVLAYDKDLNPTIFYFILSGNEDGIFELNKLTGALYLVGSVDREKVSSYTLSIESVNNITDFSVIRPRNKRESDASVTTLKILVTHTNNVKPSFTQSGYYGCISTDDNLMKSILKVEAVDKDALGSSALTYSINNIKKNGADYTAQKTFLIGEQDGIVRNTEVMSKHEDGVFTMNVFAKDTVLNGKTDNAEVQVFVTKPNQAVKIVLTQPSADVYFFINQITKLISKKTENSFVCVAGIKDHMFANGQASKYWSDLFVYIIHKDTKKVFLAKESAEILNKAKLVAEPEFSGLYVNKIQVAEISEVDRERIPLLIIMILVILFIILALILTCIACWCIARSKRRNIQKATYAKNLMINGTEKNPVYSNNAFVTDDAIFIADPNMVYNNMTETIEQVEMVDSPLYSTVNKARSEMFIFPKPDQPSGPEPVIEVPLEDTVFDDPAVYTVPESEPVAFAMSETHSEQIPVIVSPLMDPEPVIETEPVDVQEANDIDVVWSSNEVYGDSSMMHSSSGAASHHSSARDLSQHSSVRQAAYSSSGVPSIQVSSAMQSSREEPSMQVSSGMQAAHYSSEMPSMQVSSGMQSVQYSSEMPTMQASSGMQAAHYSSEMPSMQVSSARQSVYSSPGEPSIQASLESVENKMEPEPVIVTSPADQESPTEALRQMDAVFDTESNSSTPVITSQVESDDYTYSHRF